MAIEVGPRSVTLTGLWLVDQPAVQLDRLVGPMLARIEVDGEVALVQSFPDPRVLRGVMSGKPPSHSYIRVDTGVIEVSVPLVQGQGMSDMRLRVVDAGGLKRRPTEPGEVARLFEDPPRGVRQLGEIAGDALRAHGDWAGVAAALGLEAKGGRFEIYRDRAGRFRWRLRRSDGEIVTSSDAGYATRAECEENLVWVRTHSSSASIVALDITRDPPRRGRKRQST